MVSLEPLACEADQLQAERELAATGKGRGLHRGRCDEAIVRELCERHLRFTGSTLALALLDDWEAARGRFVKVFPNEYKRALTEMYLAEEKTIPAVPAKAQRAAA
jgi:glutamate synthase (NADPH) large chain